MAFEMTRLFGTNGIRWIIGKRTPDFAVRLGITAGNFYGPSKKIANGMDPRTSSPMVFNAVVSGLISTGINVTDLGMVPTPLVQFAVKRMKLDGGLMVTASHNPPEFNGLKFFASDGTELSRAQEEQVERLYAGELATVDWNKVGKCQSETMIQSTYKNSIKSYLEPGCKNVQVVVDCANGAACDITPDILTSAGCKVFTLNSQPDGQFPGRMPEPVEENVGMLMAAVREHGADLGIAHDGDADRATFVDEKGNYISGDQSLALFALDALKRSGSGTIVVPINTSRMVEDSVKENGGKIEYTAVGSPLIARRMMEINAILGGEGNGGIIFPEHQLCRDGMMAAARMINIAASHGPLSALVLKLPKYCIRSEKIRISPEIKEQLFEEIRKETEGPVIELDGIKTVGDDHWVLIRASGTEPIIRVTVETQEEGQCVKILEEKV
ncbi:MAG: phosphoglucosamine mutase, partial [Thermoplasmata archaeon]|nr:phosphoglucosamine mutase [Thermoplasmata archaeon]